MKSYLGEGPVISDLVWIENKGRRGRRMIVNLKRSGVSAASRKTERGLLPRTRDSVWDLIGYSPGRQVPPVVRGASMLLSSTSPTPSGRFPSGNLRGSSQYWSTMAPTSCSSELLRDLTMPLFGGRGRWPWHAASLLRSAPTMRPRHWAAGVRALAILVMLRAWAPRWRGNRV